MEREITPDVPRLLRQREVAELLHVSTRTLEKWRVSGHGPRFVKVGRGCLYRVEDIESWLATRLRDRTRGRSDAPRTNSEVTA